MRKLFLLLFIGFLPLVLHAQTAKAIWCAGNTTLYFTYDTNTYAAGGTYDGQTITKVYNVNGSYSYGWDTYIPWKDIRYSVTNVTVAPNFYNFRLFSLAFMFCNFTKLTTVTGLDYFDTSYVTNMESLFYNCRSLTSLEQLSGWDTGNVTNMHRLFYNCSSLTSLEPLSGWDTSKVTNMESLFSSCSGVTSLDPLSGWDTGKVTNMLNLFSLCSGVTSLEPLRNWDTGNVTDMTGTFLDCSGVTSLEPLSGWDTGNVTRMWGTFSFCSGVTSLEPLRNWDTGNVTNMESLFSYCSGLTLVEPLSGWDIGKVTYMSEMFYNCNQLKGITFGENFNMNKVSYSDNMFQNCSNLRYIDFYNSNYETSGSGLQFPLNTVNRSSGTFNGVPETTVIYMPHGNSYGTEVTNVRNVVYPNNGNDNDLRCHDYYSEDKVDIEFPRDFKTNEAVYTRAMSNSYGSVVLPYAFTTNDNIQAYTLDAEHTETMYFKDIATVPAHTPFAFKKLAGSTADFTMTDSNNNFGITVRATQSTNATEDTWTDSKGAPYEDVSNINMGAGSNVTGWSTKGYYINETVSDYDGAFYIASDRFYKANGALTMYPHRVTFHGAWTLGGSNNAKSYAIGTASNLLETAIEAADLRKTEREADAIYDMQGRKVEKLQHGLNIVRMSDGTVRKVISNK